MIPELKDGGNRRENFNKFRSGHATIDLELFLPLTTDSITGSVSPSSSLFTSLLCTVLIKRKSRSGRIIDVVVVRIGRNFDLKLLLLESA